MPIPNFRHGDLSAKCPKQDLTSWSFYCEVWPREIHLAPEAGEMSQPRHTYYGGEADVEGEENREGG